jgi:hypothetical protein
MRMSLQRISSKSKMFGGKQNKPQGRMLMSMIGMYMENDDVSYGGQMLPPKSRKASVVSTDGDSPVYWQRDSFASNAFNEHNKVRVVKNVVVCLRSPPSLTLTPTPTPTLFYSLTLTLTLTQQGK